MKIFLFLIIMTSALSCQGPSGERAVTGEAGKAERIPENYTVFTVDTGKSTIEWIGARPASQHNGTVSISDGYLMVTNGEIAGGEFVIDLTSIIVLDIPDPSRNARLVSHLESDDFFDTENHPEARFDITGVERVENSPDRYTTHRITGNLQMRGITRSVSFGATVDLSGERVAANSVRFLIDRTQWGVNYQSNTIFANLADRFILDDICTYRLTLLLFGHRDGTLNCRSRAGNVIRITINKH
jgi:polyisoprenoid-binding protein YceI